MKDLTHPRVANLHSSSPLMHDCVCVLPDLGDSLQVAWLANVAYELFINECYDRQKWNERESWRRNGTMFYVTPLPARGCFCLQKLI